VREEVPVKLKPRRGSTVGAYHVSVSPHKYTRKKAVISYEEHFSYTYMGCNKDNNCSGSQVKNGIVDSRTRLVKPIAVERESGFKQSV